MKQRLIYNREKVIYQKKKWYGWKTYGWLFDSVLEYYTIEELFKFFEGTGELKRSA